jgi:DNA repair protein RadA
MKKSSEEDLATPKPESHFITARTHYINSLNSIERLTTGSKNIDDLLFGGVETKAVTEFYGAPGSGKTQLCHTMCAIVPQDKSKGGVCGKSIYIDTEGTFRTERIVEIAKARGFDHSVIVDTVTVAEAQDSDQQDRIVNNLDSLLQNKTERFKLLIVDAPVTHYRSEYIGRAMLPERQQKLFRFMRRLVKIAHEYNIAVVVTNQINTTPTSQKIYSDGPIGGNAMSHAATYGVRLSTLPGGLIHYARILHSPYHPEKENVFYIRDKGVVDD